MSAWCAQASSRAAVSYGVDEKDFNENALAAFKELQRPSKPESGFPAIICIYENRFDSDPSSESTILLTQSDFEPVLINKKKN